MANFVYEPLPDLEAYLARMGYTGSRELTRETLNALVYAHQCSIPFENLSCCDYDEPVVLDIPSLYDKIVNRKRGGYCFELNGIFAAMLRAFGFDAYSTMCRLARTDELRPVMHRGVVVRLDGKHYFCDVGYGGPMAPFAIELSPERQTFYGETFWVEESVDGWWRVSRRRGYVRRQDTDVHGTVVVLLKLCAESRRFDVGLLRYNEKHGSIRGKTVHAGARYRCRYFLCRFTAANGDVIWLTVAGGRR